MLRAPITSFQTTPYSQWAQNGNFIYYEDGTTITQAVSAAARNVWESSPGSDINFTSGNSGSQIWFQEVTGPDENWLAQLDASTYPPALLQYNMYFLDGDFGVTDGESYRAYPLWGMRYHKQSIAIHELGHFLGLNHNTVFGKSIMADNAEFCFIWGTNGPRDDADWAVINALY